MWVKLVDFVNIRFLLIDNSQSPRRKERKIFEQAQREKEKWLNELLRAFISHNKAQNQIVFWSKITTQLAWCSPLTITQLNKLKVLRDKLNFLKVCLSIVRWWQGTKWAKQNIPYHLGCAAELCIVVTFLHYQLNMCNCQHHLHWLLPLRGRNLLRFPWGRF